MHLWKGHTHAVLVMSTFLMFMPVMARYFRFQTLVVVLRCHICRFVDAGAKHGQSGPFLSSEKLKRDVGKSEYLTSSGAAILYDMLAMWQKNEANQVVGV